MDWGEGTVALIPSKCLVCGALSYSNTGKYTDETAVNSSLSVLDKQLNIILILRDFLEVPSERLQTFLECDGDPSGWGVGICSDCNGGVRKVMKVHRKLLKILEKFRATREVLIKKIKRNCGRTTKRLSEKDRQGVKDSVTDQCRSFVQNYDYANIKNSFIAGDAEARRKLAQDMSAIKEATDVCDDDFLYIPLPTISSVKIEVNEEDDSYEPSQDDMLHFKFSSDEDEGNFLISGDHEDDPDPNEFVDDSDDGVAGSEESDFDEKKIKNGEGVYYNKTKQNNFKCIKCGDLKRTLKDIISHEKLHKCSPHKCKNCPRVYSDHPALRKHVQKYHPDVADQLPKLGKPPSAFKDSGDSSNRRKFKMCKLCGVTMPIRKIEGHNKLWHGSSPASKNGIKPKNDIGENLERNTEEGDLEQDLVAPQNNQCCSTCKKTFVKEEELNRHLKLHKTSPFHCYVCLHVFKNESKMNSHTRLSHTKKRSLTAAKPQKKRKASCSVTKSGKIRCSKCTRFFPPDEIEAHERLHETSPFSCYACGNVFASETTLRKHLSRFHRRLYKEMKRVNQKAPLTVKLNPEYFPEDETDVSSDDEENKGRIACPLCKKYYFKPDSSEKLCEHLEKCPAIRSGMEGNDDLDLQEMNLCCPICKEFNISLKSKMEFGEHILICKEIVGGSDICQGKRTPLTRRLFECEVCPTKKYFQLEDFIKHYQDHFVKTWKCVECQKRYLNTTYLNGHFKNHTYLTTIVPTNERYTKADVLPQLIWWCRLCDEKFSNEDERDLHLRVCHLRESGERPHDCNICQKGYACPDELNFHKGITHIRESLRLESVLPCDLCDDFFMSQKDLDVHKRKVHRVNLLVCEVCGIECATEINFKIHKQLHLDVKDHQCDECTESFTTAGYLRVHKFRVHTPCDKNINPLVCKYCDRAFCSATSLRLHEASQHTQKFKFVCEICGFGAMVQFMMTRHMANKHQVGVAKTWTCPVESCGKVYSSPANFKAHQNMHAGLPPEHICDYCGKGFYSSAKRWKHEVIHKNAETLPYRCDLCGKRYPRHDYLYIHKRTHNKGN